MGDLDKLIEAVDGGRACKTHEGWMHLPIITLPSGRMTAVINLAWDAYNGSLDAAKALHEAMLPGWGYKLEGHVKVYFAWVGMEDEMLFPQHSTSYENPARAWLLAILKAHRAALAAKEG